MVIESQKETIQKIGFNCYFNQNKSKFEYNHIGNLIVENNKILKTPIIWFGLSVIESYDFQIKVFEDCKIEAILSNAYDLMVQDKKGIREKLILELEKKGIYHKMDSGGFQLMKAINKKQKLKIDLTQELVYDLQQKFTPDIAVQLDFPLSPGLTNNIQKKLIDKTFHNFEKLMQLHDNENITLMPVCHGYSEEMLEYSISRYEDLIGDIQIIGIGSLVPLVKTIKGSNEVGGKKKFIQNLIYIRKRLPNTMIHAFGIGGTMAYLAFYCGIDSIDSSGWIQKSGYGVIQLPGTPDRFIIPQKHHNRPYLLTKRYNKRLDKEINERNLFMVCKCPACREYNPLIKKKPLLNLWNRKKLVFNGKTQESRLLRSIHNVYVQQSELNKIREGIEKGNLDKFIKERLTMSNYYNLFDYATELKRD